MELGECGLRGTYHRVWFGWNIPLGVVWVEHTMECHLGGTYHWVWFGWNIPCGVVWVVLSMHRHAESCSHAIIGFGENSDCGRLKGEILSDLWKLSA